MTMTARRGRMLEALHRHGVASTTQPCALDAVNHLAQHSRRAPDPRSEGESRQYGLDLIHERPIAERTCRLPLAGSRFFDERTRQRPGPGFERIRPRPRQKLPVVLSPQEVRSLLALVERAKARRCLQRI
jgi:integrase